MEDNKIIDLFFARNEAAIEETDKKYGRYCHTIAHNILASNEDAKECVNDTYLRAWNTIPPTRPDCLSAFLARICRNLALGKHEYEHAARRRKNLCTALDELEGVLSSGDCSPSDEIAIKDALNTFAASLSKRDRIIFVQRYFYILPIKDIARAAGESESNTKIILMRTRNKLKSHLEKEGILI